MPITITSNPIQVITVTHEQPVIVVQQKSEQIIRVHDNGHAQFKEYEFEYEGTEDEVTELTVPNLELATHINVFRNSIPLKKYVGNGAIPKTGFKISGNQLLFSLPIKVGERIYAKSNTDISN